MFVCLWHAEVPRYPHLPVQEPSPVSFYFEALARNLNTSVSVCSSCSRSGWHCCIHCQRPWCIGSARAFIIHQGIESVLLCVASRILASANIQRVMQLTAPSWTLDLVGDVYVVGRLLTRYFATFDDLEEMLFILLQSYKIFQLPPLNLPLRDL